MQEVRTTVILPCAGSGKRLGLDTPKELYEVEKGVPMIQYSLDLILKDLGACHHLGVAVVISPGKEAVAEFVVEYLKPYSVEVSMVYFDSDLKEWPGSIHSARRFYRENNLVLLPDSYLGLSNGNRDRFEDGTGIIQKTQQTLDKNDWVLFHKQTELGTTISQLGAVHVDTASETVIGFQDKPADPTKFNGFWTAFAFRGKIGADLHQFLIGSVEKREGEYDSESFYPAQAVEVFDYSDLGTWDRIDAFLEQL